MKSKKPSIKNYLKEFRKLAILTSKLQNTEALAQILINDLIYLYLVVEEILVDRNFKKNIIF